MADAARQVGLREVVLVALGAVAVVLGASILTSLLPTDLQRLVFHAPVAITVLIAGTAYVLWRVARRPTEPVDLAGSAPEPPGPDRPPAP